MKRRAALCFALLASFMFLTGWSAAQDSDDIQQGIKAYGTYHGGDIDSVSMINGNLMLDIPLVSYPQRGNLSLGYRLVSNGKNYTLRTVCAAGDCTIYVDQITWGSPVVPVRSGAYYQKETTVQLAGSPNLEVSWYSLVGTDGASHILAQMSSGVSETVDGTGLQGGTDAN